MRLLLAMLLAANGGRRDRTFVPGHLPPGITIADIGSWLGLALRVRVSVWRKVELLYPAIWGGFWNIAIRPSVCPMAQLPRL